MQSSRFVGGTGSGISMSASALLSSAVDAVSSSEWPQQEHEPHERFLWRRQQQQQQQHTRMSPASTSISINSRAVTQRLTVSVARFIPPVTALETMSTALKMVSDTKMSVADDMAAYTARAECARVGRALRDVGPATLLNGRKIKARHVTKNYWLQFCTLRPWPYHIDRRSNRHQIASILSYGRLFEQVGSHATAGRPAHPYDCPRLHDDACYPPLCQTVRISAGSRQHHML